MSIEVIFPLQARCQFASPMEEQRAVIARLRDAGVPIYGEAFLVDLDRGILTIKVRDDRSIVYTWKGP